MAIAIALKDFLYTSGVNYDLVPHPYSFNTTQAAENAHISGEKVAKGVVLHDFQGYVMAVIPATHKVELTELRKRYHRYLSLADEVDLPRLFKDCTVGAVPPIGKAYDVQMIMDDHLNDSPDVYFEAGDHTDLVHVSSGSFHHLIGDVPHGDFSRHI